MPRPRFVIMSASPRYCDRDSVIGWSYRLEASAETYAFAARQCAALNEYDCEHGGDGCFDLYTWKADQWGSRWDRIYRDPDAIEPPAFVDDWDCPF